MAVTLIMVRHGESEANRKKIFAGHYDADLSENGLMQAKRTAECIKSHYKVDKVYASDLRRAYKTGKCIADLYGTEAIKNKKLREIYAGEWDGKSFSDLTLQYEKEYGVWLSDIGNASCPGGETVKELGERVMSELTRLAEENDGKTIVAATHATPIRAMQSLVQTGGLSEMKNIPWVSNASYSVFEYNNRKWNIIKINEASHLGEIKTNLPENV